MSVWLPQALASPLRLILTWLFVGQREFLFSSGAPVPPEALQCAALEVKSSGLRPNADHKFRVQPRVPSLNMSQGIPHRVNVLAQGVVS